MEKSNLSMTYNEHKKVLKQLPVNMNTPEFFLSSSEYYHISTKSKVSYKVRY
jgi:hypothetical protein